MSPVLIARMRAMSDTNSDRRVCRFSVCFEFSAAGAKRLPVYQVFDGSLVLVDLPQSLIISLHLIDKLSQVLSKRGDTQTHTQ